MSTLTILLVDDHEVVRIGLKSLIDRHANFEVVAEAATEKEAVQKAVAYRPDIVLMDIRLKDGSGIAACEQILAKLPCTKIIMLTSYAEDEMLFAAIRVGAVGYVLKQLGSQNIIVALEAAARGEASLDPSLTQSVFQEMRRAMKKQDDPAFADLTTHEKNVLALITKGWTNHEIAESLFLSEGTVRNYVSLMLSKLAVANRAEAAAYAIQHHLMDNL